MTEAFLCSVCGESHPLEDRREFEDQELCARVRHPHLAG